MVYIKQVNQLSHLIINNVNFYTKLKYLEFDMKCDFYWNNNSEIGNSFILFNIYKFINLEVLKLTLSFPDEKLFDKIKGKEENRKEKLKINFADMNKNNKGILQRLKSIHIKWCFITLRTIDLHPWRNAPEMMDCYDVGSPWSTDLDGVVTSTRYWNDIVFDCINYLLYFVDDKNNYGSLKELVMDCPQWYSGDRFGKDEINSLIDLYVSTLNRCGVKKAQFGHLHPDFAISLTDCINNYGLTNMSELEIRIDDFGESQIDQFKDCYPKLIKLMCRDGLEKMR